MTLDDAAVAGERRQIETIDLPYDRPDFSPYVKAFFTLLREGAWYEPDQQALGHLRDDMPADLKALIHTWAHKSESSWLDFGFWEIQRRSLDSFPGLAGGRAVIIGQGYHHEFLVATWSSADREMQIWSDNPEENEREKLGSFSSFLAQLWNSYVDFMLSDPDNDEDELEQSKDLAALIKLAES